MIFQGQHTQIFKNYHLASLKSSIISNKRKVSVLAMGFLISRGANPFNHPPSLRNRLSYTKIKCSENLCCSVRPCVCSLALMISKGCVKAVAIIPEKTPAGNLCQPIALNSS